MAEYEACDLCPRFCGVNRLEGEKGFCGEGANIRLATAALHFGEEPPLSGGGGSGALFFSGCTMGCPFCQNWQISRGEEGRELTPIQLAQIMMELQKKGAENINFVTGTQFLPSIEAGVKEAKSLGLNIPLVWNCSGYENEKAMVILDSFIDIYLPDFKAGTPDLSKRLFRLEDYGFFALSAIRKMVNSRSLKFNDRDIMTEGVIIRHLVLPGELESSRRFFSLFAKEFKGRALISVMVQYTPVKVPGVKVLIPQRHVSQLEYETLLDYLQEFEIMEGFFQDLKPGGDWLPDFKKAVPFSYEKTNVIWSSHRAGFISVR